MSVAVHIVDGPLVCDIVRGEQRHADAELGEAGAVVCFEGVVRAHENGRPIEALDYEAYEPMATRELHRLADDATRTFGLLSVQVEHSRGRVPVGQCSFRLRIAAARRGAALQAMAAFIERLKQDVPIWKTPVYSTAAAESPDADHPCATTLKPVPPARPEGRGSDPVASGEQGFETG